MNCLRTKVRQRSSSGLGCKPVTLKTGVQIPFEALLKSLTDIIITDGYESSHKFGHLRRDGAGAPLSIGGIPEGHGQPAGHHTYLP